MTHKHMHVHVLHSRGIHTETVKKLWALVLGASPYARCVICVRISTGPRGKVADLHAHPPVNLHGHPVPDLCAAACCGDAAAICRPSAALPFWHEDAA